MFVLFASLLFDIDYGEVSGWLVGVYVHVVFETCIFLAQHLKRL